MRKSAAAVPLRGLGVDRSQVAPGQDVLGVELDGLGEVGERFAEVAKAHLTDSAIIPETGVLWVEGRRPGLGFEMRRATVLARRALGATGLEPRAVGLGLDGLRVIGEGEVPFL